MNILGIGGLGYRDASAALLVDGRIVAAAAEERFTGRKHQGGWPARAVAWCLEAAGVDADDLDRVAVANNPWIPLRERVVDWYGESFFESDRFRALHIFHDEIHDSLRWLGHFEELRRRYGDHLVVVPHHVSHLAAGFLGSSDELASLLVLDGRGEVSTSATATGRGTAMEVHRVERMPNSLGLFSAAVADYLGFHAQDDEFRVMSMSATGEPRWAAALAEVVRREDGGGFVLDPAWFAFHEGRAVLSDRFREAFGEPRAAGAPVEDRHRDLAASVQRAIEDAALHMAADLRTRSDAASLIVSGSLAQNWALNGRLAREAGFERVAVAPWCGDDGTALGAAWQVHVDVTGARPEPLTRADLGPSIDAANVAETLVECRLASETLADPAARIGELLAGGAIVGWARGRCEFGPRALGHRSILVDATRPEAAERLRRSVKRRETHHPFGVSMTEEEAGRSLLSGSGNPWLLVPARVEEGRRGVLATAVLADGSLRVQTVAAAADPLLHAVLASLGESRGLAAAINTSLNLPGRPPATNAREALEVFFTTGMDALVLEDRLLLKENAG